MRINGPVLVSLAILAGIGGWMFTGKLIQGGIDNPNAETIAEREAKRTKAAFRVRVIDVQPTERVALLNIRGRTMADAQVSVRAETGGTVERRGRCRGRRPANRRLPESADRRCENRSTSEGRHGGAPRQGIPPMGCALR